MGSNFALPIREPIWYSYYGPIYHTEASEALDSAIRSHLQEIGAGSTIPIREEKAPELYIPVSLAPDPFSIADGNNIQIAYASTCVGTIKITANGTTTTMGMTSGLNQSFTIGKEPGNVTIEFLFEEQSVTGRIYEIQIEKEGQASIINDKIIVDGVTSTISRIFRQNPDEGGDEDEDLCLLCYSHPSSVVALPCRHCFMCRECAERFAAVSTLCPVCRATVHELLDWKEESQ